MNSIFRAPVPTPVLALATTPELDFPTTDDSPAYREKPVK